MDKKAKHIFDNVLGEDFYKKVSDSGAIYTGGISYDFFEEISYLYNEKGMFDAMECYLFLSIEDCKLWKVMKKDFLSQHPQAHTESVITKLHADTVQFYGNTFVIYSNGRDNQSILVPTMNNKAEDCVLIKKLK